LIAIVPSSAIVSSYENALERLGIGPASATLPTRIHFVTGPSRTADIEEILLLGAHGPCEVCVLVIDGM
jgi:L-lactate utilization protein LutC